MLDRFRGESAGPWLLAIGVAFLAFFLVALAVMYSHIYESVYNDYATNAYKAGAQQEAQEHCASLTTVEEATACLMERIGTYGEAQRSQEDLYAQKKMAEWAFWMLLVTWTVGVGTVAVTGLGVYWVKETLVATQDMARDARRIGEAQVRAYLSVEIDSVDVRPPRAETGDDSSDAPNLVVEIKSRLINSGQSPAHRAEAYFTIEEVAPGQNRMLRGTQGMQKVGRSPVGISASGWVEQSYKRVFKADRRSIANGKTLIWVAIYVEYDDVFGERDCTDYLSGHIDMTSGESRIIFDTVIAEQSPSDNDAD